MFLFFSLAIVGMEKIFKNFIILMSLVGMFYFVKRPNRFSEEKYLFCSIFLYSGYHFFHDMLVLGSVNGALGYIKYILIIPLFYYFIEYGFSRRAVQLGMVVGLFLAFIGAVYEYFFLGIHRVGVGNNPIAFSTMVYIYAVLVLGFSVRYEELFDIKLIAGVLFMSTVMVALSGTRGVLLSFMIMLPLFLFLSRELIDFKSRGFLFVLAFFVFFLSVVFNLSGVQDRVASTKKEIEKIALGELDSSIGQRIQMLDIGRYLVMEYPAFGTGDSRERIGDFSKNYIEEKGYLELYPLYSHFHNDFLDEFVKYGFFGFILMMGLYVCSSYSRARGILVLPVLMVLSLATCGLSDSPMNTNIIQVAFVLFIALSRSLESSDWRFSDEKNKVLSK
jgi:O-antigen ligase